MSEKHKNKHEASKQTIADLYKQAADYLETMLERNLAQVAPTHAPYQINVSVDVPALNGKRLRLEYDRANSDEDLSQVDRNVPLTYTDEIGKNHWWTPIGMKVYGENGALMHDYDVMMTDDPDSAVAYDKQGEDDPATGELPTISALDAKEIVAQLEWALEQQPQV